VHCSKCLPEPGFGQFTHTPFLSELLAQLPKNCLRVFVGTRIIFVADEVVERRKLAIAWNIGHGSRLAGGRVHGLGESKHPGLPELRYQCWK
jgi:hypothetical protein